jgi:uncharacterized membrane protein YccC
VLHGRSAAETERERRQLAAAETEIHLLSKHLPFDTSNLREITNVVHALHTRTLVLIPIIDGLNDRLSALRADGHALSPEVADLIEQVATWIADGADRNGRTAARRAAIRRRRHAPRRRLGHAAVGQPADPPGRPGGDTGRQPHPARPRTPQQTPVGGAGGTGGYQRTSPLHRDYGMALLSASAASIAVLLSCALWIVSGWRDGAAAAMIAAVVCCFFATMDDPKPTIASFGIFNLVALPIAAVFQFVLPQVSDFPMLVLVLAPILLPMGVYMAARAPWCPQWP